MIDRAMRGRRLRRAEGRALAPDEGERLLDSERPLVEINVVAGEPGELAEPQARCGSDPHEGAEPGMDGFGDAFDVVPIEWRTLDGSFDRRALDVDRVHSDQAVVDGGVQHRPEESVDLGHGVGVQP